MYNLCKEYHRPSVLKQIFSSNLSYFVTTAIYMHHYSTYECWEFPMHKSFQLISEAILTAELNVFQLVTLQETMLTLVNCNDPDIHHWLTPQPLLCQTNNHTASTYYISNKANSSPEETRSTLCNVICKTLSNVIIITFSP